MDNQETKSPSLAIIGAGKVGTTIGVLAIKKGYAINAIVGRNFNRLEQVSARLGNPQICSAEEAAKLADIVFLSVSDDAIEALCAQLASSSSFKKNQIVVHFSGALSSEVLATARDACGALIASTHPLQTFSSVDSAIEDLPGTFWFCEGDPSALTVLTELIESIGGQPRFIPTDKKVLYHAASVIACNYLTTLMDLAQVVAESASLSREDAWKALEPLVQATLRNISVSGTTNALTGPISRGDVKTVARHLQALSETDAEITQIYKQLGLWTTRIAERQGLSPEMSEELVRLLSNNPVELKNSPAADN